MIFHGEPTKVLLLNSQKDRSSRKSNNKPLLFLREKNNEFQDMSNSNYHNEVVTTTPVFEIKIIKL